MSFKNTIIILTSNLGSSYILEMGQKDPDSVKDMVMSIVSPVPLFCLPALKLPLTGVRTVKLPPWLPHEGRVLHCTTAPDPGLRSCAKYIEFTEWLLLRVLACLSTAICLCQHTAWQTEANAALLQGSHRHIVMT